MLSERKFACLVLRALTWAMFASAPMASVIAQPVSANQLARHAGQDVHEWSSFVGAPAGASPVGPSVEVSMAVLQRGGPWVAPSPSGLTTAQEQAMGMALAGQWSQLLPLLKDKGVQPDFRDLQGRTLLTLAAQAGDLAAVRGLMAQGADPDRVGAKGLTPLGMAAWRGHELVVRELLFVGADVGRPDAMGQTALHLAAQMGHVRVMSMLMAAGARTDVFNRAGLTPLLEAASLGQVPAMERLVQAGVPLTQVGRHGLNAVHFSALTEQKQAVLWLTGQGVPVQGAITQVLIETIGRRPITVR